MQLNAASERLLRELDGDIEEAPENLTGDFRTWRIYRADGVEVGPDENPLQLALGGRPWTPRSSGS